MAVEITPTVVSDEFAARRREWLAATAASQAHAEDCFACLTGWLPRCEAGEALRAAADEAMRQYEGVVCA